MNQPYGQAYQPPPSAPTRAKMPWWGTLLLIMGVLNLLLTGYLVVVVVRAQVALAEFQQQLQNFPSGLFGGLGG